MMRIQDIYSQGKGWDFLVQVSVNTAKLWAPQLGCLCNQSEAIAMSRDLYRERPEMPRHSMRDENWWPNRNVGWNGLGKELCLWSAR